jgi:hypothetical protein
MGNELDLALLRVKELVEALEAMSRGDDDLQAHIVGAMAETIGEKLSTAVELLANERREKVNG